jgi:hypothetical protein
LIEVLNVVDRGLFLEAFLWPIDCETGDCCIKCYNEIKLKTPIIF